MQILKKLALFISIALVATGMFISLTNHSVLAAPVLPSPAPGSPPPSGSPTPPPPLTCTSISCIRNNPIVKDINGLVNFLSIGVGIVVTAMIIVGGIQYMAAGDNPNAVTAAKQRITNALIALAVFLVAFAFLQWLIPGGVFG